MSDSINSVPRSGRLHIGFFGRRNAGKSSLVNALTGHSTAIVSAEAGTTTDPVYKSMEIHGLGPCVLIDTAGFDDMADELGRLRVGKTRDALDKTDIAVLVAGWDADPVEAEWIKAIRAKKIPHVVLLSKCDLLEPGRMDAILDARERELGERPFPVSAETRGGMGGLMERLLRLVPADWGVLSLTGTLCGEGDVVVLVMPQDIQAPQGRLILPQVRVTRELLDKKCILVSCTTDKLEKALSSLAASPKLIITDSQAFDAVWKRKPAGTLLTSFSILMAAEKGDIRTFVKSAEAMGRLGPDSRVLIAEACTHAPLAEDIGRVKIPAALRKRFGNGMRIDMVSGTDFPASTEQYDLIIHCGGCMFNRTYMMSRLARAAESGTPMTNYGVALAWLTGILDRVSLPYGTD